MLLEIFNAYDNSSRLTGQSINLANKTYTVSYTYDEDEVGRMIDMTVSDGEGFASSYSISYDELLRLETLSNEVAEISYSYKNGAGYNSTTNLVQAIDIEPTSGSSLDEVHLRYEYIALGNITAIYDDVLGSKSRLYEYDVQGQLRKVKNTSGVALGEYSYDASGNILIAKETTAGTTIEYYIKDWMSAI